MLKLIFALTLTSTSMALACKMTRAGASARTYSAVVDYAAQKMSMGSEIKSIYLESKTGLMAIEILNEKNECQARLFSVQFGASCNVKINEVIPFSPVKCK